jgi:hypothetical protein
MSQQKFFDLRVPTPRGSWAMGSVKRINMNESVTKADMTQRYVRRAVPKEQTLLWRTKVRAQTENKFGFSCADNEF